MLRHAFPGARLRPPPATDGAGTNADADDDDDDDDDFVKVSRPAPPPLPLRSIAAFVDEHDAAQRKVHAELHQPYP